MKVNLTFEQVVYENGKRISRVVNAKTFRDLTTHTKGLKRWLDALVAGSPYRAVFIEERPSKTATKGATRKSLNEVFREALVKRALATSHDTWQYPSRLYGVGQPKPERVKAVKEALINDPVVLKQWELVRRFTDRDYAKARYELNLPRR